ncbi:putative membrane protein [Chitinophaga niastensis]|uniref:Putative membrane protein n=1 Tax=Chitinophaga niastensis TaxID=536980 RepID=A0A2P8HJG5_CHINA|nr:TMEM175 family protein [Chitinophaga niastensis]PSL46356.1 putative membrane protein [Chitinophaga niastensis]
MNKGRLEAFSDGVIAIIITIMVLEMKVPHSDSIQSLIPLVPVFISYILSFIYVGIYWNNHHHMLQTVTSINGRVLWANLHLLFWLSIIPFVTGWMGENHFSQWPAVLYGCVLFMCGIAYNILSRELIKHDGEHSKLRAAIKTDIKGKVSVAFYIIAIACAMINSWISFGLYILVALIWFVPDRRIEKVLNTEK